MNADRQTHTHRSSALQGIRRGGVRSGDTTGTQRGLCTGQTTCALSSCTSKIKSNNVRCLIAEIFDDTEKCTRQRVLIVTDK